MAGQPSICAFDVEALGFILPPHKDVRGTLPSGCDQFQRVAQPAANGSVDDRDGSARSATPLENPVDEAVFQIEENLFGNLRLVVANSASTLEDGDEGENLEIREGVVVLVWGVVKAGQATLGVFLHLAGHQIRLFHAAEFVDLFRAGKSLSTGQVEIDEVVRTEFRVRGADEGAEIRG
jgi:hypothetical protein